MKSSWQSLKNVLYVTSAKQKDSIKIRCTKGQSSCVGTAHHLSENSAAHRSEEPTLPQLKLFMSVD